MISFKATCKKSTVVDGTVVECDETFEGAEGAARFTAHMKGVHRASVRRNSGVEAAGWICTKPAAWKAPKAGTMPPKGARLDAFLAAMVVDIEAAA